MPYDLTYLCNLKNTMNKQAEQKHTRRYREYFEGCQREEVGWMSKKGEEIKKYKFEITK